MEDMDINQHNGKNSTVNDDGNKVSDIDELRKKLQLYLKTMEGTENPIVMGLFKELNETLEHPDSETKHTVSMQE